MKTRVFPLFLTAVFAGVAFLYFTTSAPGLVWAPPRTGSLLASLLDSRYFSLAESPFYFFVGRALALLFPTSVFARVMNLFSSAAALAFLAVFFFTVKVVSGNKKAALLAVLSLACFPFFWRFALFANYHSFWLFLSGLFLFFLFRAERNVGFVFPALAVFSLALLVIPFSIFLAVPLGILLVRKRGYFDRRDVVLLSVCFALPLLIIVPAAGSLGVDLARYVSVLEPLASAGRSAAENAVFYFESYFHNFYFVIFVLSFLGFLFWEGENKLLVRSLAVSLAVFLISPFSEFAGGYLLLTSVVFLYAALGFAVVWSMFTELFNTEIGVAFENRFFVLVFRLKERAKLVRYFLLGVLVFLNSLTIFWNLPLRFRKLSRRKDTEAGQYAEKARRGVAERSVVLAEKENYLSALRYASVLGHEKHIWVISPYFDALQMEETARRYPNLEIPDLDKYYTGVPGSGFWFKELVRRNEEEWNFYLTLERAARGEGLEVGAWEGYPLVAQEPLYEVKTTDSR